MKAKYLIPFFVVVLGAYFAVTRNLEKQQTVEQSQKSEDLKDSNVEKNEPSTKLKEVETPSVSANQKKAQLLKTQIKNISRETSLQKKIESIREILKIDQKVLKNSDEKEAYENALMNEELVLASREVLTTYQEPKGKGELLDGQKERMDAALFLTRAIEWQGNPNWNYVADQIGEIVLDDSFHDLKSVDYKKSIAADRIELFANLKDINHDKGLEIEKRVNSPSVQKIITFANNFYELNKKGK